MNEKFKELYAYLKDNNLTDLDENSFFSKYSDPSKSKEIYSYLKSEGMTDLDESKFHAEYFGGSKKKESTESPSESDQKVSSLVSKEEVQSESKEGNGGSDLGFSGVEGKIYSGYPGKEKNQYRFIGGKWQKRVPVSKTIKGTNMSSAIMLRHAKKSNKYSDWKVITNEGSTNALNRTFRDKKEKPYVEKLTGLPEERLDGGYRYMGPKKVYDDEAGSVVRVTPKDPDLSLIPGAEASKTVKKDFVPPLTAPVDYTGKKLYSEDRVARLEEAMNLQLESAKNQGATEAQIKEIKKDFEPEIEKEKRNLDVINRNEEKNKSDVWESMSNYAKSPDDVKIDKAITADLGNMSGTEIQSKLEKELKDYGFTVYEGEDGTVDIVDYRGDVSVGPFNIKDGGREEVMRLREFVKSKRTTKEFRDRIEKAQKEGPEALADAMIEDFAINTDLHPEGWYEDVTEGQISKRTHEVSMEKMDLDSKREDLSSRMRALEERVKSPDGLTQEALDEYNKLSLESEQLNEKYSEVNEKYTDLIEKEKYIDMKVSTMLINKAKEEEKEGSTLGGIWNSLLGGVESFSQTGVSISANILPHLLPDAGMNPMQYAILKNQGKTDSEIVDMSKKMLLKTVDTKGAMVDLFGSETTEAYLRSEDRSMFEQAIFGLAETVPALIGGGKNKFMSFAALSSLSYAHIESEMRDNPAFEGVSEAEKKLVSVPYAIAMGFLENLGFSKLMHKNPVAKKFTNSVIHKVFNNAPEGASIAYIEKAIKEEIERNIQKGTFKIVEGFLVEGETGALQELGDIGIKEVYNSVKGKKMFETPESFKEGAYQVLQGSIMEAMGGGVMSGMLHAPSIMRNGVAASGVDSRTFDALMTMGADPEFKSELVAKVKLGIIKGEISEQEGGDIIENYDKMMAVVDKVPEDISDPRKAFDLIREKQLLESKVKGKDEAAVTKERKRISDINAELEQMSVSTDPVSATETETDQKVETDKKIETAKESETKKPEPKEETEAEVEIGTETDDTPVVESEEAIEAETKEDVESDLNIDTKPFESAFSKGAKSTEEFLRGIEKRIDDYGKKNLGMNVPVVVAKKAVQAARLAAQTAKNVSEVIDAAINEVKKSNWYKNELDSEGKRKAEMETQRLFTDPPKERKSKPKTQSKVDKATGVTKSTKKVTVSERAALRTQITLEARAARKGAKFETKARENIGDTVKGILGKTKSKVKAKKVESIVARAMKMNLSNPVMADRFISYVENVAKDAEYDGKVSRGFEKRGAIRGLRKSKGMQVEVKNMLSDFASIDPRNVENIDEHLEMAESLKKFATPTRVRSGKLNLKDFSDMSAMNDYISKQKERQDKIDKDTLQIQFPELFESGVLNELMSPSDMRAVISSIGKEGGPEISNEKEIAARLSQVMDSYVAVGDVMVEDGIDPVTGENVDMTSSEVQAFKAIKGVDTSRLSIKDLMQLVDATGNLITNRFTGGVENITSVIEGIEKSDSFFKKHGKSKKLGLFLRAFDYHFASLPVLIDTIMLGPNKGNAFMTASGLNELIQSNGSAQIQASSTLDSYLSKFGKKKPNGQKFNSAENAYERGMISFLMRNIPGTEAEIRSEFERRKGIVRETVDYMNSDKSSSKESKKGKVYKKVFDKLDLDNSSYETFLKNADKTNVDAVKWWVDTWSENYSEFRDVALSVYNSELSRDTSYTPDRYKTRSSKQDLDLADVAKGMVVDQEKMHTDESSPLMKTTKPKKLPIDKVVDFDFDVNNHSMFESALIDVRTAKPIRKVQGFISSKSFDDAFSPETKKLLNTRISNYVRRVRKKDFIRQDQMRMFKKITNSIAKMGTAKVLGGIDQIPKQTISVMLNTLTNTGGRSGLADAMKKGASEWFSKSGLPIATRGVGAETAIEVSDNRLNRMSDYYGKADKAMTWLGDQYLKQFLSNPDKFVARASFIAFYKNNLKSRGLDTNIVFSKPMDMEAANYAQHMVDRQQNVSDVNLAGEFFLNRSDFADATRKVFFPFANFVMNQKARMYSDIRAVSSRQTNMDDRKSSVKSLAGLAVEMIAFHGISILIRSLYKDLAEEITGFEPDGKSKRIDNDVKRENNLRKMSGKDAMSESEEEKFRIAKHREYEAAKGWKTFYTSIVRDVFSVVPPTDDITVSIFNEIAGTVSGPRRNSKEVNDEVDAENFARSEQGKDPMSKREEDLFRDNILEREAFQLWEQDDDAGYGVLSIGSDKWSEYVKVSEAAEDGIIRLDYNGIETIKYLTPEDQEIAKLNKISMALYVYGIVPSDFGKESRYIHKLLEKKALTETQMQKYEFFKEKKGEVSEEDMKLVRSKKTLSRISKDFSIAEAIKSGEIEMEDIEGEETEKQEVEIEGSN